MWKVVILLDFAHFCESSWRVSDGNHLRFFLQMLKNDLQFACSENQYIYLRAVDQYNDKILVLFLSISILPYTSLHFSRKYCIILYYVLLFILVYLSNIYPLLLLLIRLRFHKQKLDQFRC